MEVTGDPGNEDFWREQVLIDRWMDDGCPEPDAWLAGFNSRPRRFPEPAAPSKPAALPPSELAHLHALTKAQAGQMLGGKSEDWIEKHVLPHVATVRASRSVLIPAAELKRWVDAHSGRARG